MADNNIDRYNPAAKTTYEDVARQRKLAEEENYTPATLPETTTPLVPNYMPGEGVYAQPKFPDYASRIAAAEYEEPYIAKEISNWLVTATGGLHLPRRLLIPMDRR